MEEPANPVELKVLQEKQEKETVEHTLSELKSAEEAYEAFLKRKLETEVKESVPKSQVKLVADILGRVVRAVTKLNETSERCREENYWVVYNATILIYKVCKQLRKAAYSREATKFLAFNLLCLDNNLILTTAKYLQWRVKNYVTLARTYADI